MLDATQFLSKETIQEGKRRKRIDIGLLVGMIGVGGAAIYGEYLADKEKGEGFVEYATEGGIITCAGLNRETSATLQKVGNSVMVLIPSESVPVESVHINYNLCKKQ